MLYFKNFIITGLLSFVFCFTLCAQAIEQYHRIRIDIKDKNPFILFRAGLPMDHGKFVKSKYFESDFSDSEIALIHKLGFTTETIIRDVETYYANPDRPSELVNTDYNGRNNICHQISKDYKTPFNYFSGSMAGYFTYEEMTIILEWMRDLYPNIISELQTIEGIETHNGNVIKYIKLSDNPDMDETSEPKVLYTALHHAREPNSLSQMIFYLWYMLENYSKDAEIKYLVDHSEMYFIPCVNPDGYMINESNRPEGGGMWRKNGWKDDEGRLKGVDLNRNYGYQWGFDNEGSSDNVNSDTYRGASAFSEPETQAVRKLVMEKNFDLALNYHTFGNYLIHPWGFSDGPTGEDVIFKRLGNVMVDENNFLLGTGTETVGYTTNGDSDDYLFGEQIEKNKIYSFTPEVGYSFWPAAKDIDFLNKSCLQMNLSLPRLALGYIEHELYHKDQLLSSTESEIEVKFENPGLKQSSARIDIHLVSPESKLLYSEQLDLNGGAYKDVNALIQLSPEMLKVGINDIQLAINKDYGSYRTSDTILFTYFNGKRDTIFYDKANDMFNWESNGNWGNAMTVFTSAPSSITDSPMQLYNKNSVNTLKLFEGLDLSGGKSPVLKFNARWAIEAEYDYASVYAFVPGRDTIRFCGNHTNLGSEFQLLNQPIYDGIQDQWIEEFIPLSEFEGEENVYIQFELVTDANLEMDGMYIDDVTVFIHQPLPTAVNDIKEKKPLIYPNPTNQSVSFRAPVDFVVINDMFGKRVGSRKVINNHLNIEDINNGVYILQSYYKGQFIDQTKLTIIK